MVDGIHYAVLFEFHAEAFSFALITLISKEVIEVDASFSICLTGKAGFCAGKTGVDYCVLWGGRKGKQHSCSRQTSRSVLSVFRARWYVSRYTFPLRF